MAQTALDSLLSLEDDFYQDGYRLGAEDGRRAGHIEGRAFGLERGFEKFMEMGRLHGRSSVWMARRPHSAEERTVITRPESTHPAIAIDTSSVARLPRLPLSSRVEKQVRTLVALSEPESLSVQNDENSVSDFDDRLRRAQGKMRIIEKATGEDSQSSVVLQDGNIEDSSILHARH
ncbi:hypothetical protein MMC20_000700 [Loxospora ochrophaea]|nr:hypothetical protein [Loxospora ochrophaea]